MALHDRDLCTCDRSDGCDAEGDPGCDYCQKIDPEWPCPADVDQQLAPLRRLSLVPECEDCGASWVERGVKHWRPDGSRVCWWLVT